MATELGVNGVTFSQLWSSFDTGTPCTNPDFSNQCAIRVSEVLLANGLSLASFSGTRCWNDSSPNSGKHIIRAEELANWLRRSPIPGMGPTQEVSPDDYQGELSGKTGIIFFKDYWTRSGEAQENRSGDHIDLWDGSKTSGYWFGWTRGARETFGLGSDRNESRAVWFWEID